jgi:hypothetical protein
LEENHKIKPKSRPGCCCCKKKEIETLLENNRSEIEAGKLRALMIDECHLMWGDLSGYIWAAAFVGKLPHETCLGKTDQEIMVPVVNEREKQTYYGAIDYLEGGLILKTYDAGNSKNTIDYLRYLLEQSPNQRLLIFWDGASYHRSQEIKNFLDEVNQGLSTDQWKIHCVRFAPNCPVQNPPIGCLVASQNLGSTFLRFDPFIPPFEMDV